jgi:hypothetical protein
MIRSTRGDKVDEIFCALQVGRGEQARYTIYRGSLKPELFLSSSEFVVIIPVSPFSRSKPWYLRGTPYCSREIYWVNSRLQISVSRRFHELASKKVKNLFTLVVLLIIEIFISAKSQAP